MKGQAKRVVVRLLTAANQASGLEALAESQVKDPLQVEVYNKIRDDYLEDITRTMSCTSRVDPETPADFLMSDLTEQDEILTRYSSHDLQEAYKLTHIERDDISIAGDTSSDFELYGKEKSDDDDKESSADKEESRYKLLIYLLACVSHSSWLCAGDQRLCGISAVRCVVFGLTFCF